MEEILKNELDLEYCKKCGMCCGTNQSIIMETEKGKMFVKCCEDRQLAEGEFESLKAIRDTGSIACPTPICTIKFGPNNFGLVTNYVDMSRTRGLESKLAHQLADMHAHRSTGASFGFHVPTCCGKLAQENEQDCSTWKEFFIRHRLAPQLEKAGFIHDRAQLDALYEKTWKILERRDNIAPSLVHGDLWGGNWSGHQGEPIIFDPSSSFSDPEFEFGIMSLFGGLTKSFQDQYFEKSDFQPGFEQRLLLYELYHLLNHYNHFGGSYKSSAQRKIQEILM